MLKVALIFYFCLWVILLIAGVMLWSLAVSSGTVDNVETFVTELFALESFTFNADQIFRASAIGGLVLVVAGAGFTVLMAVLFNLISDVTGGVRFTVVEERPLVPGRSDFVPPRMLDRCRRQSASAWRGACPCDGQRTQRRGCRTAPDEALPPRTSLRSPAQQTSSSDPSRRRVGCRSRNRWPRRRGRQWRRRPLALSAARGYSSVG